ncbi:MAG: N-acetyl-gamma-glutamyl-phosphate reductase [Candidatus Omnitrophica bacterium]|nr:N-acetyl-gamma-glutamyl-phosphate reductase [Candidatus Omnitrophota bacterium]
MKKIKIAVIGATGFTGEKLVELLLGHNSVELTYLSSRTPEPVKYCEMFPKFLNRTELLCEPTDMKKAAKSADIIFLSLPHTVSFGFVPYLISQGKKIIDLSADYRLKDTKIYKKYYKAEHTDKKNLNTAVYGMPELCGYEEKIAKADVIANPGCYPTAVTLGVYPMFKNKLIETDIIVDAKSSITGAGRKALLTNHYSNIANNIWAYKPFLHQHVPEMTAVLKETTGKDINLNFVPQVIGVDAGIYANIYVKFKNKTTALNIKNIYKKFYKNKPFVRILDGMPSLKNVVNTNFCDIGFAVSDDGKTGLVVSCIDNLIKGAAGTAVQNMNIMCGYSQTEGLL